MADNAEVNSGSGVVVATDQIGTAHYQYVKLVDGTLDSTTPIPGGAAGLSVQLGSNPGISGTAVVSITGIPSVLLSSNPGLSGTAVASITGGIALSTVGVPISGGITLTTIGVPISGGVGLTTVGVPISGNVTVVLATGAVAQSGTGVMTLTGTGVVTLTGTGMVTITGTVAVNPTNPVGISGALTVNPVGISGTAVAKVAGDVSASAADSGNPVKIGGVARITNPTAVSDGNRVNAAFDDLGRQLVLLGQPRDLIAQQFTLTATAAEVTALNVGGAGVFLDLVGLVLANSGSSNVSVIIKDSAGGQNMMGVVLVPGGGIAYSFARPWPQRSANQAYTITMDTAITVYCSMLAEKNV